MKPLSVIARAYTQAGISVIPCNADKTPTVKWTRYQGRIPQSGEIKTMFRHGIEHLAMITGEVSGNVEVLDFDAKGELWRVWAEIVNQENPELYRRLNVEKSQNSGKHVKYRCPYVQIPKNTKLAMKGIEVSGPGEHEYKGKRLQAKKQSGKWYIFINLIETRGEGGYCLVAPSQGYEQEQGGLYDIPVITAAERSLLIDTARSLNQWVEPTSYHGKYTKQTRPAGGILPGEDFDERGNIVALLEKHGWERTGKTSTVNGEPAEHLRRPGKNKGHSATLINGKMLYVFSSNASPFEPGKAYGPFAVYAILEHEGDFTKAASALSKHGYGTPGKAAKPKARGRTLSELVKKFSCKVTYHWRQHLPKGMPSIINGREGTGKTSICLAIAREMLQEHPDGIIYWVASEGFVSDTVVKASAVGLPMDGAFRIAEKPDGTYRFDLRFLKERNLLAGILEEVKDRLLCVFIDSVRGMSGGDDNDPKTGSVMHNVNSIVCDQFGATLVYIDHHKKGRVKNLLDRSVGTTAKTAAVRVVLSVLPCSTYTRKIVLAKSNVSSVMPVLKSVQVGENIIISQDEDASGETLTSKAEQWLLSIFSENPSQRSTHIYKEGELEGFSEPLLKKAKQSLGIKSEKKGHDWYWVFPLENSNSCVSWNSSPVSISKSLEKQKLLKGYSRDTENGRDTRDTTKHSRNSWCDCSINGGFDDFGSEYVEEIL